MAEYIAREAAIVDFERVNHENPVWTPQRVKTLLMRIPTADVEPVNWISVEDKLPANETEVLAVCVRNGYCFVCPVIYEDGTVLTQDSVWNWYELDNYGTYSEENDDYFVPKGWWENRQFTPDDVYNNPVDCAVTHWMPLPEPPKEDGGEDG